MIIGICALSPPGVIGVRHRTDVSVNEASAQCQDDYILLEIEDYCCELKVFAVSIP